MHIFLILCKRKERSKVCKCTHALLADCPKKKVPGKRKVKEGVKMKRE